MDSEDQPIAATSHFTQSKGLHTSALRKALRDLSEYEKDDFERNMVLDIKNNLAMLYARREETAFTDEAHQLIKDIEPWGNGAKGNIWEYLETACYVRYNLPRGAHDRAIALRDIQKVLRRDDITPEKKQQLKARYNLADS